jgi:hypothetical protein
MTTKHVTPFVGAAFNCPHCGALAHQTWFKGYVAAYKEGDYPTDVPDDFRANIRTWDCDDESKANLAEYCELKKAGRVFTDSGENKFVEPLVNFDLTKCFSCREFSLWIVRRLIYPANDTNVRAHPDMPSDLVGDFEEAARISRISPRGSAALLRLCVQKLCMHLGGKGKDINADVALLVKNGLSVRVRACPEFCV